MRRPTALRVPLLDLGMSLVLVVVAVAETSSIDVVTHRGAAVLAEVVMAAAITWRRVRPAPTTAVVGAAIIADTLAGMPPQSPYVPMVTVLIMMYTVVSYCSARDAVLGTALVLVSVALQVWLGGQSWDNLAFIYTFVGIFWAFGRIVRMRSAQAVASELRAERLQIEHDERARRIVVEERSRIARELHDVIAHSVSVMVVQAGAAQQVLRDDPAVAAAALENVQRTGRESINELGRLLGVLRDDSEELGFAPQPTLAELPRLVADARSAGLAVELTTEGEAVDLPAGVELAVYRVVQEALTNTRKHAGDRPRAAVRLAYRPDGVLVEVTDDGSGGPSVSGLSSGHGLVGMRERVAAYGGTLVTGGQLGRGYRISARIPLGAQE